MTNNNTRGMKNSFSFFIFQLSLILGLSVNVFADFTKSNGVVTDTKTSLQWQDDYSDNGDNVKQTTWTSAIDYCEALSLGGHSDWRLPNKKELLSIVDYSSYNPSINTTFDHTTSSYYWSSSTDANDASHAWFVNFYYGYTGYGAKSNSGYVRCVR